MNNKSVLKSTGVELASVSSKLSVNGCIIELHYGAFKLVKISVGRTKTKCDQL